MTQSFVTSRNCRSVDKMAKTIKSLLRISMAIRNLGTLNGCTLAKRFIHTASSYNARYNKDALVSPQPHLISEKTPQTPVFKYCEDHAEVFSTVRACESTMRGPDAATALHALFQIDKKNSQRTAEIYEQEDFLLLCEILKKNIRQLDVSDAILALKAFVHFNVPSTSVIVQTVLQLIRHSVNELTIQQMEFLEFLFERCQRTPIIDALRVAMPIVYERNIFTELDRENIKSIVAAFRYMAKRSENTEVLGVLIHAIKKCKTPLNESLARNVLWTSFDIRCYPPGLSSLLYDVQSLLAQNITNQDRRSIQAMMKHLALNMRSRGQQYYHEGLVDACASVVISEDWGFADAIEILNRLIMMGHTQIFLLDYIAAKCFEDPTILETCPPSEILSLITGFSHADYKPVFWEVIQEYVTRLIDHAEELRFPQTKLVVNLLSLDCYRPKLVEKVFASYATELPIRWAERSRLLLLYQAIKTLHPQYSGPWPAQECMDIPPPRPMKTSKDFPLLVTLESALGGRSYVLTNVRSSLGHIIDHVLVMRKGGFPIAINNDADRASDEHPVRQLDEIQKPPPDSQVILLLYVPAQAYSINSQRMKGAWSLQLRTLEALSGYTVIPIQSSMWTSLPAMEKIPYLMQAIRLKCDDISISANP